MSAGVPAGSGGGGFGGYLEGLTPGDLAMVLRLAGRPPAEAGDALAMLRRQPGLVEETLASPAAAEMLLRSVPDDPEREAFVTASPFLVFAVAVERVAADLREATYVSEWVGPRQRLPLLGGDDLRELLDDRRRRVFLAALLASYTRVASGTVWRETPRGWRRQRFSELDPVRLAATLDVLPESRHPAVHRRLGDLALFLAGVFPDHTAARAFGPIELQRLGRAAAVAGPAGEVLGEALETRGGVGLLDQLGARWYRLAAAASPPAGASTRLLEAVAERFVQARRALNLLADRHLFPSHREWFPAP
ncbi:MAG TPA: hypothetical protein VK904_05255 [Miltoncostaeaceae bacterium]|nr:hypothetical protein [Miltoncostaeaceae bacterium]